MEIKKLTEEEVIELRAQGYSVYQMKRNIYMVIADMNKEKCHSEEWHRMW